MRAGSLVSDQSGVNHAIFPGHRDVVFHELVTSDETDMKTWLTQFRSIFILSITSVLSSLSCQGSLWLVKNILISSKICFLEINKIDIFRDLCRRYQCAEACTSRIQTWQELRKFSDHLTNCKKYNLFLLQIFSADSP